MIDAKAKINVRLSVSAMPSKSIMIMLAAIAGVFIYLWVSSVLFLTFHHMPSISATPFTILKYFETYGHIKSYQKGFVFAAGLPIAVLIGIALFMFCQSNQQTLHGDARFAKRNEIRKSGLLAHNSKSILVGQYQNQYLSYSGSQFVMLAAPTRSGKGVGVVIPNCLNYSDSLVVLDIKLENFDVSAGFRAKHGQDVYLFSPFDEKGKTHRYNPLGYISNDPNQRIDDIFSIAYAFYQDPDSGMRFGHRMLVIYSLAYVYICVKRLQSPEPLASCYAKLQAKASRSKTILPSSSTIVQSQISPSRPFVWMR